MKFISFIHRYQSKTAQTEKRRISRTADQTENSQKRQRAYV